MQKSEQHFMSFFELSMNVYYGDVINYLIGNSIFISLAAYAM